MIDTREIVGIQYLRGIAALLVVIYHLSVQFAQLRPGAVVCETLQSGVDIFFVISGFVMFYSTDGGRRIGPGEFLKRRIVRIVPLYWAVTGGMIVILLVAPMLVKTSVLEPAHALASLIFVPVVNPAAHGTYLPLVTPGWTLNYEMFFYAIFTGALAATMGKERGVAALIAIPLILLALIGFGARPGGVVGFYTNPVILEFLFGIVIAIWWRSGPQPCSRAMFALLAAAFVLLIAPPMGDRSYRVLRFGLPAAAVLLAAICAPWRRLPALHLLGDTSYSLYLSHFFVASAIAQLWREFGLHALPGGVLLFQAAGIFAAIPVGIVTWRWIERPLTDLARRALEGGKPVRRAAV